MHDFKNEAQSTFRSFSIWSGYFSNRAVYSFVNVDVVVRRLKKKFTAVRPRFVVHAHRIRRQLFVRFDFFFVQFFSFVALVASFDGWFLYFVRHTAISNQPTDDDEQYL